MMEVHMKRKYISCLLALSMISCMTAGCGTAKNIEKSEQPEVNTTAAKTTSGEGAVTLEMWTLLNQTDVESEAWKSAIAEYEANHPGITVNRTQYEGEAYKMKLKSAVAADALPDIFFSWTGGFSQPFVEAGKVYPLDDTYTMFESDLSSSMLDTCRYHEQLYGAVITLSASLLYYNQSMFDEYGLKVPETYDELITVCQKFIDNGITPFAISAKDTWGLATMMDQLMLKCVGRDDVVNTITRNGGTVDERFLDAANKFVQLKQMGAFLENASGINTDEAYQYYINGTCPMWLMVDSLGNSVTANLENAEDYGVALFPACSENATTKDMMGGCGEMYCVSSSSDYSEEAATAVFEICRSIAKYTSEKGSYTSAWNNQPLGEGSPAFIYDVETLKAEADSYMLWWDTTMVAADAQEYLGLLQELYNDNISTEEFNRALSALFSN